jgi:Protein of unknown function (DUF2637)
LIVIGADMSTTASPTDRGQLEQLVRIRTGVRAVLTLGVAASIAANVLHAQPTIVGRAIAAWSPLALLLTVELISRVPVDRRALSALRMTATAAIAGIAAWVSYTHMVGVATRYGEQPTSAHLLPLSVDGLVVVASISLVEIAGRLRALHGLTATADQRPVQQADTEPAPPADVQATAPDAGPSEGTAGPATPTPTPAPAPAPAPAVSRTRRARTTPGRVSLDELLPIGQTVAQELTAQGKTLSRRALQAGLRERGHSLSTDRATELLTRLESAA